MSRLGPIARAMKKPDPSIFLMMAQSCYKLEQFSEAAFWYDKAALPNLANRSQIQLLAANVYARVKNWQRALEISRDVVKADPNSMEALALYRSALRTLLVFDEMDASNAKVLRALQNGDAAMLGMEKLLDHLFWCADEAIASRLTRMDKFTAFTAESRAARRAYPHVFGKKIRVAYLSNDLSDRHATMRLLQGVMLRHDASEFEIFTLCHTDEALKALDQGMRYRLPNVTPISGLTDQQVADKIRTSEIDILVDLKGHTRDPRLGILNLGAAPIQVAWLGYPGINTGIDCDYMIGDPVVTPDSSAPFWDASFCRLPETYQSNDDTYRELPPAATRAQLGLPEDKVIFASFNSTLKVSPKTFSLWMRVLNAAPDSVLWMLCDNQIARANFLKAAREKGVKSERIIFADFADYRDHIARLQAADIGIDTFPCNGHTTTSDKLWAGLPLATLRGTSFASRVSESLLTAIGVPELVADTEEDYVALSARLATDHAYRTALRNRITGNRFRAPLFDTERFTRHLEAAYRMMVDRARTGLPPAAIDVPALAPRDKPFR